MKLRIRISVVDECKGDALQSGWFEKMVGVRSTRIVYEFRNGIEVEGKC
jgi:hypothetical protein